MPARRSQPEPEVDPEEVLLSALRRWQTSSVVYDDARAEMDSARADLVAALHDLGIKGFSL